LAALFCNIRNSLFFQKNIATPTTDLDCKYLKLNLVANLKKFVLRQMPVFTESLIFKKYSDIKSPGLKN
jgi:hypothetical protein